MRFEKKRIGADFRALAESLGAEARMLDAHIAARPIVSDEDERAAREAMDAASFRVSQAIAKVRAKANAEHQSSLDRVEDIASW